MRDHSGKISEQSPQKAQKAQLLPSREQSYHAEDKTDDPAHFREDSWEEITDQYKQVTNDNYGLTNELGYPKSFYSRPYNMYGPRRKSSR